MTDSPPTLDARGRELRDLRISLTDYCNLRCSYCMPHEVFGSDYAFLPPEELLSYEEIARIAALAAGLGVRKIKLTGGEPLSRAFVPQLVQMLRAAAPGVEIDLITNGLLLAPLAERLKAAGLDRITISLDTLKPERFAELTGRGDQLATVLHAIDAALAAGFDPIKINTVVIRGQNDDEVVDLARRFRGPRTILRFIEYMDVGTVNHWRREAVVPSAEILARLQAWTDLEPIDPAYRGETAARYRYTDGSGEVGFISSVSQPFCGDCNRLRLSADGQLYTCLFAKTGTDLRHLLRQGADDNALGRTLRQVWQRRRDQYSAERDRRAGLKKIEMFYIGG